MVLTEKDYSLFDMKLREMAVKMENIQKDFNRDIKVDMHIHTYASDGTWNPETLVKKLVEKDISVFSVTDHDSLQNTKAVRELALANGLRFIPGIEVNSSYNGGNYHILGYGIDVKSKPLNSLILRNREMMEGKDDECIDYLAKKNSNVTLTEYNEYSNDRERGGWKALNYLIDKGLCSNLIDFFKLFDECGNPLNATAFPSPSEVAEAIISAGGFPVLAHPDAAFYNGEFKSTITFMLDNGIMGLECYHPENSSEVTEHCLKICKSHNLLISGGSDCHGEFSFSRRLGFPEIHLHQLYLGSLL